MVRVAISQAAFDAIAGMLPFPLGSVSYENASNAKGERYVWLDPKVVEHLRPFVVRARATATLSCGWRPSLEAAGWS
jgi:hypothetical protein